jgi:hypothetical protein
MPRRPGPALFGGVYAQVVVRLLLRYAARISALGLAMLATGIVLALAVDVVVGIAVIGAAAVLLAVSQPLLVQSVRASVGRRAAPRNGHPGPTLPEDVDPYLKR